MHTQDGDGTRAGYVGDNACLSCHRNQSLTYALTAHHLTSQLPNQGSILGSFGEGSNVLKIADPAPAIGDPGVSYRMLKKGDSFYESAITGFPGKLQTQTERIDIVIGSGVRGQSYLYWHGNLLYELPVSYWSDGKQWINSPGYRNGPPNFLRPASPRCLECHATYIRALSSDPATNQYDETSLVPGISCEICHGPGAKHIAMHRAALSAQGEAVHDEGILNPATFSRDRQVDMCGLCHDGAQQEETAPTFSYLPGEPLNKYLRPNPADTDLHPDVHADQVGLLKRSRCYLSSPNMTCSTCHQIHAPEQPAASYSIRCRSCHQVKSCGIAKTMGYKIAKDCIDCHMPVEQTNAIVSETADKIIRTTMRTHWIKVYPSAGMQ
ncbi:MAG: multiheme c-type cytochrome [Silvibacterium sp.]